MPSTKTETLNLHQKMLNIMSDVTALPKLGKNMHQKYDYVSHDQISEAVRDLCVTHRVFPHMNTENYEVHESGHCTICVKLTYVDVDKPEDTISYLAYHTQPAMGGKESGAAYSYATKYAYGKSLLISGCSPELDNEDSSGSKSSGPIKGNPSAKATHMQIKEIWKASKKHNVSENYVNLYLRLLGLESENVMTKGQVDSTISWISGGGKLDKDEQITQSAVFLILALLQKSGKSITSLEEELGKKVSLLTVQEFALLYKKLVAE